MSEISVTELSERVHKLEEENEKLSKEKQHLTDTVEWMHDMIWELIRKNRPMNMA